MPPTEPLSTKEMDGLERVLVMCEQGKGHNPGMISLNVETFRRLLNAARSEPRSPSGTGESGGDPVNDTKYAFRDGRVWNRADGLPIPDDEPVMLFRARDRKAMMHIEAYRGDCADYAHRVAVAHAVDRFVAFAKAHPDRMKEPDTAAPEVPGSSDSPGGEGR